MKTVFDQVTREQLIARISTLNENSDAQWGKMNVYQVLLHCCGFEEMALGKKKYKQVFIGRLFGKMALKSMVKDVRPIGKNSPTIPDLVIKETSGDFNAAKACWIALLQEYRNFPDHDLIHPFFGKMTKEQVGYLAYKHTDHHLRQFNT